MHSARELRITVDAMSNLGQERRGTKATPQLQSRQISRNVADAGQHCEWILVGVQVSHPQDGRVSVQAGSNTGCWLIPRRKPAGAPGNLKWRRGGGDQPGPKKGRRLLQGEKRNT